MILGTKDRGQDTTHYFTPLQKNNRKGVRKLSPALTSFSSTEILLCKSAHVFTFLLYNCLWHGKNRCEKRCQAPF